MTCQHWPYFQVHQIYHNKSQHGHLPTFSIFIDTDVCSITTPVNQTLVYPTGSLLHWASRLVRRGWCLVLRGWLFIYEAFHVGSGNTNCLHWVPNPTQSPNLHYCTIKHNTLGKCNFHVILKLFTILRAPVPNVLVTICNEEPYARHDGLKLFLFFLFFGFINYSHHSG